MTAQSFRVPDVSCQGCAAAITGEVGRASGVSGVDADRERELVSVEHDGSPTDAQLRAGIAEAGCGIAA